MATVAVEVITDQTSDTPITIEKQDTELPSKFFVDYASALTREGKSISLAGDPQSAILYDSYNDYTSNKQGRNIDMKLNANQNGIRTTEPKMCLFFQVTNQSG